MAFTRSELRAILGDAHTDEIEQKLVNLHRGVVDSLKDQLDSERRESQKWKTEADKLTAIQMELDDLKAADYRGKYEKEHNDFEAYKGKVAQDAETEKLKAAYRKMLIEEKVSEKALDSILGVTDFSEMKLDENGNLTDADKLRQGISDKWGGFVVSARARGENVDNPPKAGNGSMTKEEILKIADTSARQKAIAENLDLFGKG